MAHQSKYMAVCLSAVLLFCCGCGENAYANFDFHTQDASNLKPAANHTVQTHYEDHAPQDETVRTVHSADHLCTIEQKKHYFDVTLDLTSGRHAAAGKAYAEAILEINPDYIPLLESYLYENIRFTFNGADTEVYEMLTERTEMLFDSLPKDYKDELNGFSECICNGKEGFEEDGFLSREECLLAQMIPDLLRNSACSAVTIGGSRTESGKRLTARMLEWPAGTKDQQCEAHCVLHLKNGRHSVTLISVLGAFDTFTGINQKGVLAGILDVSSHDQDFNAKNKSSYTFALRYALEQYTTAKNVGDYMVAHAPEFTFCHNLILTDAKDAFCAEICVTDTDGKPLLRTEDTPLNDGLQWDCPDALCTVNGFAAKGNYDGMTGNLHNIVRWERFREWFGGDTVFSAGSFKERLTSEDGTASGLHQVGANNSCFHIAIANYDMKTVETAFAVPDASGEPPVFYQVADFQ